MSAPSRNNEIEKSLNLSLIDAFLYALMVGAGETYLPAYVLSLGLSEWMAGMIATMPLLSGAFLQILGIEALRAVKNHKLWVWTLSLLQAGTFIPLIFFASGSKPHFLTLFCVLTFYWGAGFCVAPSWNYWMGNLVNPQNAQKFFSLRGRISQFGILLGLVLGGIALHNKIHLGPFTSTFGLIFFIAFVSRSLSSWMLTRKYYEKLWTAQSTYLHIKESWKIFFSDKKKRNFFLSVLPFQMAMYLSSPFVTPYMLAQLKMNYGQYMTAVSFLMIGKILSTYIIDRTKNFHHQTAFKWGLFIISPAPFFWIFSNNFVYILVLQFVSGTAFGFFEVGLALLFFQGLNAEEKVPFLTFYNVLNCAGLLIGSALGGIWLKTQHSQLHSYYILFGVGACFRIMGSLFLYRQARHVPRAQ
jgi:MFS family permease